MVVNRKRVSSPPIYCLQFCLFSILFSVSPVFAILESAAEGGCGIQSVHDLGFRGQNVRIGLITLRHARVTHEAFFDKDAAGNPTGSSHVHTIDPTDNPVYEPDWHDTPMAGIIASRGGSQYPDHLGMAPAADIYNAKVTEPDPQNPSGRLFSMHWLEAALDQLVAEGVHVAVSGFQLSAVADGQSPYTLLYDYYADQFDIVFTNAAGNSAAAITTFGDSYNGITIAGLIDNPTNIYSGIGSTSNPGPTADNRRKPDIAAPAKSLWVPASGSDTDWNSKGNSGETSWAAPHAAGCAAVLAGFAQSTPEPDDGRSEVIKAVLVNSAFPNIREKSGTSTTGQVWNAHRGYGRIDTRRAFETLSAGRINPSETTGQERGWACEVITRPREETLFQITGQKNQRLLTTLTWHRRIIKEGPLSYTAESPGFSLNLTATDPFGQVIFSETGTPDNLRKADLLLQANGIYEIAVTSASSQTGRDYALAFELLPPMEADFNTDYIVDIADLAALSNLWLRSGFAAVPVVDLVIDGFIDMQDFSTFSTCWMQTDPMYYPLP